MLLKTKSLPILSFRTKCCSPCHFERSERSERSREISFLRSARRNGGDFSTPALRASGRNDKGRHQAPPAEMTMPLCHPERSEAESRDLSAKRLRSKCARHNCLIRGGRPRSAGASCRVHAGRYRPYAWRFRLVRRPYPRHRAWEAAGHDDHRCLR